MTYKISKASVNNIDRHFEGLLDDPRIDRIVILTPDNLVIRISKLKRPDNPKFGVRIRKGEGNGGSTIQYFTNELKLTAFGLEFSAKDHGYVCCDVERLIGVGVDVQKQYVYDW